MNLGDWDPKEIRILCVDDEKVARLSLQRALKSCGFTDISVAASGTEALELLEAHEGYDLILSDLHMPEIDGKALIRRIRSSEKHADTTIVLLSATHDLGSVFECLQLGADDYILKPIQVASLKNVWSNVYRKHRELEVQGRLFSITKDQETKEKQLDKMNEEVSKMEREKLKMEKEIRRWKTQFNEAVDTPIDVISRTILSLQQADSQLSPDVRGALGTIVKALNSSNLYRPALSKYVGEGKGDEATRSWLRDTLSVDIGSTPGEVEAPAPLTWPTPNPGLVENPDGARAQIRNWNFNAWKYSEGELLCFLEEMVLDFDLHTTFDIPLHVLRNFLLEVRKNYSVTNPYHNFRHACDVTQATYCIIVKSRSHKTLTSVEMLGLLIGSICHDLDHPGLNNNFQVHTSSPLAIKYNDKSVLENHHASMAFKLLGNPTYNILCNCTPAQYRSIRTVVVNTILSTDLGVHIEKMSKFNAIIDIFNREKEEHRALLCEMILKCADISNAARPLPVSCHWSEMIQEEFFHQGDEEKRRDLKVSPFMDRDSAGLPTLTVNFIRFLAMPLFVAVAKVIPEISFTLDHLTTTQRTWQSVLDKEKESGASSEASSGEASKAPASAEEPMAEEGAAVDS